MTPIGLDITIRVHLKSISCTSTRRIQ